MSDMLAIILVLVFLGTFGMVERMRVPIPAARITAVIIIDKSPSLFV